METLSALIVQEGKLDVNEAAGWVLRLAQRINESHQQGLVHGNVSAYTLLVEGRSPLGKGILVDSPRQAEAAFYSPERAASGQLSQGDDTWALAVLLFFGLTGQYPFQVNSAIDVARAVALGTPKVARHGLNDPTLQAIFDRAFARDASKRLNTIPGLMQAIQQWVRDPAIVNIHNLEDDDEDAPTMMMQSISVGSPQQAGGPSAAATAPAVLPAPRPAAGVSVPRPAAGAPGLPPVPAPPMAPLPGLTPSVSPRQAPTLLAVRPEGDAAALSPFSKGTLTALWVAWAVVTFGGAAIEYVVLTRK